MIKYILNKLNPKPEFTPICWKTLWNDCCYAEYNYYKNELGFTNETALHALEYRIFFSSIQTNNY
jgi:hypothetical protein